MKKIVSGIFACFCLATAATAQVDTSRSSTTNNAMQNGVKQDSLMFDFYPQFNVYYNQHSRDYIYYDSLSSNWIKNRSVPSTYRYNNNSWNPNSPKTSFRYYGSDVWMNNPDHIKIYGNSINRPSDLQ